MSKVFASLKKGLKRTIPLALAGASALIVSPGFQHFVENHPSDAVYVSVAVWLLHAVGHGATSKTAA